jgi:hypothetical protein
LGSPCLGWNEHTTILPRFTIGCPQVGQRPKMRAAAGFSCGVFMGRLFRAFLAAVAVEMASVDLHDPFRLFFKAMAD